ncbi:hypothetical protein GCM10022221_77190 [Actinocorallia aurea]
MGAKIEPEPPPEPESAKAARRVARGLDRGVPPEELDQADIERTAEATASPQPPAAEREEGPQGSPHAGTGSSAQVGGKPGDPRQAERDKLAAKGPRAGREARRGRVTGNPRDDDPDRYRPRRPPSDLEG